MLPPDINKSGSDFTPDENNIRFGLASVKNVGEGVVEQVVKGREDEEYKSFYDFCTKVELKQFNKRTLESLIKAGAFVTIEKSRKQLLENFDSALNTAIRENEAKSSGQMNLFAMMAGGNAPVFVLSGSSEEEFPDSEIQGFEKDLLGFYVTSHPLSGIKDQLPFLTTHNVSELAEIREGALVTICGLISSVRLITTKSGKMLKVGTIEDLTGSVEFVAYSEILNKFGEFLEPESKVIIGGKLQHRGDEEISVNVMINNVSKVENCNIVNINMGENMKFEEIIALKDLLIEHKGTDPVVFKIGNNGSSVKILVSSSYWVQATNDLQNIIKNHFKSEVEICSLDCS